MNPHADKGFENGQPNGRLSSRFLPFAFCHLIFLLVSLACLLLSAFSLYAAGRRYEIREIKPNVFVWIPEDIRDQETDPEYSRAGTAGFIITREGVVVVDTTNSPFHARELLFEIRKRTDAPVKYVINTGARGDRVLGNEVFSDQQASIIAASAALAEMRQYQQELARRLDGDWRLQARLRGVHLTLPNQTFEGEMGLRLGEETLRLLTLDPDRPTADSAVYLPRAKVLFLGDLFENNYIPRIGSRDVRRWIEILQKLESWDVDWYVPGHGAPGDKKQLVEFRKFLEWLTSEVEAGVRQGKSLAQLKEQLVPFENFHWHAPELAAEAVEAVYHQLAGREPGAARTAPTQATPPQ